LTKLATAVDRLCDDAIAHIDARRFAEAETLLAEARALAPGNPKVHYHFAILFGDMGRHAEALAELDAALAGDDSDAKAHNNRGSVLQITGRLEEAERSFRRALELRPDLALPYVNLGKLLEQRGLPAQAMGVYDQALARGLEPEVFEQYRAALAGTTTPRSPDGWVKATFDNFAQVFANKVFFRALINTGLIIAVSLLVQLPLALAMAVLLAGRQFGAVTFRMIFFLPYILADVAAGLIWRFVFDGDYGLVSAISQSFGGEPVYMLADRQLGEIAVLVVIVWKYFGFHMMLYIAGLQGIDAALYEAARIDGAGAWQRFRFITLPQLAPMIRLSIFFSVIGSLQFFDMIIPLTNGGPSNSSHTIVSFLYAFGILRMKLGFGGAVSVLLFIARLHRSWDGSVTNKMTTGFRVGVLRLATDARC